MKCHKKLSQVLLKYPSKSDNLSTGVSLPRAKLYTIMDEFDDNIVDLKQKLKNG